MWLVSLKVLEATFCVGVKQNVQLETLSVYGRPLWRWAEFAPADKKSQVRPCIY